MMMPLLSSWKCPVPIEQGDGLTSMEMSMCSPTGTRFLVRRVRSTPLTAHADLPNCGCPEFETQEGSLPRPASPVLAQIPSLTLIIVRAVGTTCTVAWVDAYNSNTLFIL